MGIVEVAFRPGHCLGIARTLDRVNPHKIQYNADGSVTVHTDLDLRDLWDELRH